MLEPHVHTHTHTHIYIYIYRCYHTNLHYIHYKIHYVTSQTEVRRKIFHLLSMKRTVNETKIKYRYRMLFKANSI